MWIAGNSGSAMADTIIDRIEQRISSLGQHPQMGPKRPEIAADVRVLVIERWLALCSVDNDDVRIVRILDGASDLHDIPWEE